MAPKISVFNSDGERLFDVRKAQAIDMLRRGKAMRTTRRGIQIIAQPLPPTGELKCGQEAVYEGLAIEKFPVIFNGGLTRNEHQPGRNPRFKAARVPH